MLTKGQINSIGIVFQCCWSKMMIKLSAYRKQGDDAYKKLRLDALTIKSMIDILRCYDPEQENNCLTYEEINKMIQYIAGKLGICGSYHNIAETSTTCCDLTEEVFRLPIEGGGGLPPEGEGEVGVGGEGGGGLPPGNR